MLGFAGAVGGRRRGKGKGREEGEEEEEEDEEEEEEEKGEGQGCRWGFNGASRNVSARGLEAFSRDPCALGSCKYSGPWWSNVGWPLTAAGQTLLCMRWRRAR